MAIEFLKNDLERSGIYCIYCIITNKFYIGSAINFKMRWRVHTNELNRNCHRNKILQNAWNKYWSCNFAFYIVEYCEPIKEILETREQWWIDISSCCNREKGFNINPSSRNMLGYKHTEETKIKFRKPKSKEVKLKISKAHTGKIHSPEWIKARTDSREGYKHNEETKRKIGNANSISLLGHKQSEETKIKRAEKKKNKEKWPCADGWKCKCDRCREQRNLNVKNWRND